MAVVLLLWLLLLRRRRRLLLLPLPLLLPKPTVATASEGAYNIYALLHACAGCCVPMK